MRPKLLGMVALFVLCLASPALAGPGDLIEATADSAVQLIKARKLSGHTQSDKLRTIFVQQMEPLFDYREITLRALGRHRRNVTPSELNSLEPVFRAFLRELYKITLLPSSTFESLERVRTVDEILKGPYARVRTEVTVAKDDGNDTIRMNYMMVQKDDEWRIYDFELDGFGLVSAYRSQFDSVLKKGSVADLIATLRAKTKEMAAKNHDD